MLADALCCRWPKRRHRRVAFLKKSPILLTPNTKGIDDANNNLGRSADEVGEPPPAPIHRDMRTTMVEEFAIPQKPVLARANNVRQETPVVLTAPSSVLTPPAEQPFLPPVELPTPASTPRPTSAITDLDASLDCRSLDEAEAAQSQILEPSHSSSSADTSTAAAADRSHRSAKLRSSSGKEHSTALKLLLPTEPKPATAPAPLVTRPPPLEPPVQRSLPTPALSPAGDPCAVPEDATEECRTPSPAPPGDEDAAQSVQEPPAPEKHPPTPPAVSRPPIIDLRLDVEGPQARPAGVKKAPLASRRQGAQLVRPAPAHGRGRNSVSVNNSRASSQLHLQAQSQQLQLFPPTLAPVDRPRETLGNCLGNMDSHEWEHSLSAMPVLVRLVRHHPDVVLAQLHAVSAALARQVRNLRSQVARAACQAAGELFTGLRRSPEPDVEELVGSLFHRSADTNRFLRADCNAALDRMADALPPARVVQLIVAKGASHQNAVVRTVAARLLSALTGRMGADKVLSAPRELRDRLLLTGASLLTEGSLDTRCHAKQMFRHLITHPNFGSVISEVIPLQLLRNISKTLQNLK